MNQVKIPCQTKMFKIFYKQLSVLLQEKKIQYIQVVNLLDQNYYILKKVQIQYIPSKGFTVQPHVAQIFQNRTSTEDNYRAIRYYSSWIQSDFVTEYNEISEPKKEVKPNILNFIIHKQKKKEKALQIQNKPSTKETKKQKFYLYIQYESFNFLVIPKQQDRMTLFCLIYVFYLRILKLGQYPDLSLKNVVRNKQKKIKFLFSNQSQNNSSLLNLFFHLLSNNLNNKEQAKNYILNSTILTQQENILFRQASQQELPSLIKQIILKRTQKLQQVYVKNNYGSYQKMVMNVIADKFFIYNNSKIQIDLDLNECIIQYRKQIKSSMKIFYVAISHDILETIVLKFIRKSYYTKLFKELARGNT